MILLKNKIIILLLILFSNNILKSNTTDTSKFEININKYITDLDIDNAINSYLYFNDISKLSLYADSIIIVNIDNSIYFSSKIDILKILFNLYVEFDTINKTYSITTQNFEKYYNIDIHYINCKNKEFAHIKLVFYNNKMKQIHFL